MEKWRLLYEKHPSWVMGSGYPSGCCAIRVNKGLTWNPGEHIGHHVAGLIVKLHNGEMLDPDWRDLSIRTMSLNIQLEREVRAELTALGLAS
jgi:hypothetical protein